MKLTKEEKKELLDRDPETLDPREKKIVKRLRLQQKKKKRRIFLVIEIIILVLLLGALWVWSKIGKINFTGKIDTDTNDLNKETVETLSGYTNIALFGVDNRETGNYESGNSDSIMIASINNDTKEVSIVSIYRDTYWMVDADGTYRKANYAYNHGGPEEAVNALNRNMDLDIDEYVAVDFKAVADAVDAVGGVEITVDEETADAMMQCFVETENVVGRESTPVQASDSPQLLDGVQALTYARTRKTKGDDFRRASRQREVVEQLIRKAKKASAGELEDLIDSVFPEIGTSMSAADLIGLALNVKSYSLKQMIGFPFGYHTMTFNDNAVGSVVVPCTLESNVKQFYSLVMDEPDYEVSSKVKEISDTIQKRSGFTEEDAQTTPYSGLPEEPETAEPEGTGTEGTETTAQ